MNIIDN